GRRLRLRRLHRKPLPAAPLRLLPGRSSLSPGARTPAASSPFLLGGRRGKLNHGTARFERAIRVADDRPGLVPLEAVSARGYSSWKRMVKVISVATALPFTFAGLKR